MRISDVLARAADRLHRAGLANARHDAEVLLAHLLRTIRPDLPRTAAAELSAPQLDALQVLLARRAQHEPLQYMLGEAEFCGLRLRVGPGVFIPRPESEMLVRRALATCSPEGGIALELCTGSGAIACAVAIHHPRLRVLAIELSPLATAWARENVRRLNLEHQVSVLEGDLFEPLVTSRLRPRLGGRCELVIGNPPYVPRRALPALPREMGRWEPRPALDGGPDGTATIGRILEGAPEWLRPGGTLLLELGYTQIPGVIQRLAEDNRYGVPTVHRDFRGYERMLEVRRASTGPRRRC